MGRKKEPKVPLRKQRKKKTRIAGSAILSKPTDQELLRGAFGIAFYRQKRVILQGKIGKI